MKAPTIKWAAIEATRLSEKSYIFLIHLRLDDGWRKADNANVLIWKGPKTFPQDTKPDGVGDVWFFSF
jgi:hypothetical protein